MDSPTAHAIELDSCDDACPICEYVKLTQCRKENNGQVTRVYLLCDNCKQQLYVDEASCSDYHDSYRERST